MKKCYNYILSFAVCGVILSSCNDSFLDRTPVTDLNQSVYWRTISDLEAYTNGIYEEAGNNNPYMFMVGFGHNNGAASKGRSIYPLEAMSDNFATIDVGQSWASTIAAGRENVPTGNTNYSSWAWGILRRINVFVQNYNNVNADEKIKNRYLGEALFFRSWFYLYMVQNFGDVPLILEPLNTDSEELFAGRDPREKVMAQVLKDISDASTYLPEEWEEDKPNRVTKGAALALKSRIGLYEGTYRKYHNMEGAEEFLNACVEASEEIMKLGYEIYNTGNPDKDYSTLFISEDLSQNKEVIFYRKYAEGLLGHRMCGYIKNLRNGGTKDFVDDFLCLDSDGKARPVGLSHEYSNDTPEKEFTNRDLRLKQTFLEPGKEAASEIFNQSALGKFCFPRIGDMTAWPCLTGYHTIKFYSEDQAVKGFGKESSDYPLFRYAEVLLNLAEAKAELGTITPEDLTKTVDLLRKRAGMPPMDFNPPMDPKYSDLGISSLLVEIRRERRVELSFEQLRYQDLMRWAQGEKLKERVLGMRFEESDYDNPRYEGMVFRPGDPKGNNPIYIYKHTDGKCYIDAYAGTNFAAERRQFDPKRDYLRPIPKSAISKNTAIKQNPGWPQ